MDDGDGIVDARQVALNPLLRILQRVLIGALGHGQALHADADASPVHHREHAGETAMFLANQVADGAVVPHDAGRAAVDAELVLDGNRLHAVGGPEVAVRPDENLRHEKQADAAHARRRVRQTRQHEMHDVVRHVVVAVGNEDLLAADEIVVALRRRAAADQREVGTRLRFREVHRARPGAIDQVRQVRRLQGIRRMRLDRARRAVREFGAVRPGKIRRLPEFRHRDGEQFRQSLAAEIGIGAKAGPTAGAKLVKGLPEPFGHPARRRRPDRAAPLHYLRAHWSAR